jgi:hypothetical protein
LEGWHLCRSAKGTLFIKAEGEGVEPSRLIARRFSKPLPSPVGLPFRKAAVTGIEPVSGRLTAACSYQHERHRKAVSVDRFELSISCSQGTRIRRLSHTPHRFLRREWAVTKQIDLHSRVKKHPAGVEPGTVAMSGGLRHGEPAGYRYIMGANVLIGLSKSRFESTGWDSNPRRRITGAESSPLDDQCLYSSGTRGT